MAERENTVRLHRVFKAPLERVYRAFVKPDKAHGFSGEYLENVPAVIPVEMCLSRLAGIAKEARSPR